MNGHSHNTKRGFGLIEVLVASVIISLTITALYAAAVQATRLITDNTRKTQAAFLLEETMEAVRLLRDESWAANIAPLTAGTDYYLLFTGTDWQTTTTNTLVDGVFERKFVLENVNRDSNQDIAASGTPDPGTKKVTASVTWTGRTGTVTQSVATYITDIFQN